MQKNNVKKAFLIVLLVAALYAIPTFVKNAYVLRDVAPIRPYWDR